MIQKHVHKLKRHKYKTGNSVYFCILPDCHFKIDVPLALGKMTLCNICGNEFQMNEYTIKLARPHCSSCGKVRIKDEDGKVSYARKSVPPIMESIAVEKANNLQDRLSSVIQMSSSLNEDDI